MCGIRYTPLNIQTPRNEELVYMYSKVTRRQGNTHEAIFGICLHIHLSCVPYFQSHMPKNMRSTTFRVVDPKMTQQNYLTVHQRNKPSKLSLSTATCKYMQCLLLYSSYTPLILLLYSSYTPLILLLYSSYTPLILLLYSSYTHLILLLYSSYTPLILLLYSSYTHLLLLLYSSLENELQFQL